MSTNDTRTSTAEKVATYDAMVDAYVADQTPELLAHVTTAYVALPSATRGSAYPAALARAGATDPSSLPGLIGAHTDLPTSTASRVEKRQVTLDEADAIRSVIDNALAFAIDNYATDIKDQFVLDAMDDSVQRLRATVEKLNLQGRSRTTHDVDPTDVIPAGSDIVCTYKGGNVVGVLNADNTVTIGDDTYASLSKAAIAVTGQPTANGWVHWRYAGEKLAALRDAN